MEVVSNHWIGLGTGLLDWNVRLDYWINLFISHDLHPIRYAAFDYIIWLMLL